MDLSTLIILIIVIFVILCLVLFPEFRKKIQLLFGGFLNVFIEDKAKTPEGAKAVYQQAIEEAQFSYNQANDTLMQMSGKLEISKDNLVKLNAALKQTETSCENFIKASKINEAQIYSEKRDEILTDINRQTKLIAELEPMVAEAKEINNHCEQKLSALKRKSKEVIEGLKLNAQLKDMYNDMDKLKNVKVVDKLLESVDEGYTSLKENVYGSRTAHENKLSTKIEKADIEAKKLNNSEYLEELKKKYNK